MNNFLSMLKQNQKQVALTEGYDMKTFKPDLNENAGYHRQKQHWHLKQHEKYLGKNNTLSDAHALASDLHGSVASRYATNSSPSVIYKAREAAENASEKAHKLTSKS